MRLRTIALVRGFSLADFGVSTRHMGRTVLLMVLALGLGILVESLAPGMSLAAPAFLMGEDVAGPRGLVVAVNQIVRAPFVGGLGTGKKQDLVEINLTLVNTGPRAIPVDPAKEFSLRLEHPYQPVTVPGKTNFDTPFQVHPGTQSRATLFFRVDAEDHKLVPVLEFAQGTHPLRFLCDERLQKALDKSESAPLDPDEALLLARAFLDGDRPHEARKLLLPYLARPVRDPRLLIALAAAEQRRGARDVAADLLRQVGSVRGLSREDALELARQAFESGLYETSRAVLEPLAQTGSLTDSDLLFLARCWYFDGELDRAYQVLLQLDQRGFQHKFLFFTLGNIDEKNDRLVQAINWWERALQVDPNYYEALFNIGVAHYKRDDRQKAIDSWRRVLLLNPDAETRETTEEALRSVDF
jgi:tetratricopeptide (TPR) repeat protein